MPLSNKTIKEIRCYAQAHLEDLRWHREYFNFVRDQKLRSRLGQEFWAVRITYKLLEGIESKGALLRNQIKTQVLQYASIHEAIIHYVLFSVYRNNQEVKTLKQSVNRTKISVASDLMNRISNRCNVPLSEIVVTRTRPTVGDITKIRFEHKADTAYKIGLIKKKLRDDLVEIFSARNAIHLHAEIRKGQKYELELSKMAYRRLKPLKEQLLQKMIADGKR